MTGIQTELADAITEVLLNSDYISDEGSYNNDGNTLRNDGNMNDNNIETDNNEDNERRNNNDGNILNNDGNMNNNNNNDQNATTMITLVNSLQLPKGPWQNHIKIKE